MSASAPAATWWPCELPDLQRLSDIQAATQPTIPWSQIARMRDHLAHRYFDTAHAILQATVDHDLPELESAIQTMAASLTDDDEDNRAR